jgi:DNA-binding CsgD family transcriptional regulator
VLKPDEVENLYRAWDCGCTATYRDDLSRTIRLAPCESHKRGLASFTDEEAPGAHLPPDADRGRPSLTPALFVVDRALHLLSVSDDDAVQEYLPLALETLAPYLGGNLPAVVQLGEEGRLHTVPLRGRWANATIVFFEPSRDRRALRRAAERYRLTAREAEVLRLLAQTMSSAEIGAQLSIATSTVSDHVASLFRKMGCSRRTQLMAKLFADS